GQMESQIERVLKEVKRLCDQARWTEAVEAINRLPDHPKEVASLKKNVRTQSAEGMIVANTMEQVQDALRGGNVHRARQIVKGLPDHGNLKEFKTNLLRQLNQL